MCRSLCRSSGVFHFHQPVGNLKRVNHFAEKSHAVKSIMKCVELILLSWERSLLCSRNESSVWLSNWFRLRKYKVMMRETEECEIFCFALGFLLNPCAFKQRFEVKWCRFAWAVHPEMIAWCCIFCCGCISAWGLSQLLSIPSLQLSSPFPSFISHPVSPPGATTALFQVLCLFLSFLHVVWVVSLLGQGRSYCLIHFCRKDLGTRQIVIEVRQTIDSQLILWSVSVFPVPDHASPTIPTGSRLILLNTTRN